MVFITTIAVLMVFIKPVYDRRQQFYRDVTLQESWDAPGLEFGWSAVGPNFMLVGDRWNQRIGELRFFGSEFERNVVSTKDIIYAQQFDRAIGLTFTHCDLSEASSAKIRKGPWLLAFRDSVVPTSLLAEYAATNDVKCLSITKCQIVPKDASEKIVLSQFDDISLMGDDIDDKFIDGIAIEGRLRKLSISWANRLSPTALARLIERTDVENLEIAYGIAVSSDVADAIRRSSGITAVTCRDAAAARILRLELGRNELKPRSPRPEVKQ